MIGRKVLRATTIIPDTLYVDRDADRQLDAVVEEMGRPGYILVARQMGKTNLLLRMKRRRELQGDLVLYMDLSTHFDTVRDLFREIIDRLLDILNEPEVRDTILDDRSRAELEANAEYDRHLRRLLAADTHERVIIILDEIDSLVGLAYSDRILSQIRSMYFARANHMTYNKLTYVLSGVAEPTDLIKDRNVSPFNIGEKIYLNDFSPTEVGLLLAKAGLYFSSSVVDAVFEWAAGNPRMTWDIFSALEDLQHAQETVTVSSVDEIVHKLYLTRFDRAPIDHIRALAQSDRQVRDALIAVLYGKGDTLDDRARSKLYLAGITTASANEAPQIKNKVISFALSEAWLSQVEAGKRGLLEAASKRHDEADHDEAIALFERFIEEDGGETNLTDIQLMQLGLSYFQLSHLEEAMHAYDLALSKTRSSELRSILRFRLATAKLSLGSPNEALRLLEEVAKIPGSMQLRAKQQIGAALLAISPSENAQTIIDICNSVLDAIPLDQDLSEEDAAELRVISHYSLAQTYRATSRPGLVRNELRSAKNAALPNQLPGISSVLLEDELEDKERREILKEAAQIVISHRMQYDPSPAFIAFKKVSMAVLLSSALDLAEKREFEELLDIATGARPNERFATLVDLATHEPSKPSRSAKLSNLLHHALIDKELLTNATPIMRLEAARSYLLHSSYMQRDRAVAIYFDIAVDPAVSSHLRSEDLLLIIPHLSNLIRRERYDEAEKFVSFGRSKTDIFKQDSPLVFALFVFQEMKIREALNDMSRARERAREIMVLTSPTSLQDDVYASTLSDISEQLRDVAHSVLRAKGETGKISRIGRNEIVIVRDKVTGFRSNIKFKFAASRIERGELELIGILRN